MPESAARVALPFTSGERESRLARLRAAMSEAKVDVVLASPKEVYYVSTFQALGRSRLSAVPSRAATGRAHD